MAYHVLTPFMKDAEFVQYLEVLSELGLSAERDSLTRIGVVEDHQVALRIQTGLRAKMRYLTWTIRSVPSCPEPQYA